MRPIKEDLEIVEKKYALEHIWRINHRVEY